MAFLSCFCVCPRPYPAVETDHLFPKQRTLSNKVLQVCIQSILETQPYLPI